MNNLLIIIQNGKFQSFLILLLLIIASGNAMSLENQVDVIKTYGQQDMEQGFSIYSTSDGGYIIAGQSTNPSTQASDAYLLKIDKDYNLEWDQTFGGENNEQAMDVVQAPDGGYIFFGTTNSTDGNKTDFYLVKTDPEGAMQWDKTFGGSEEEEGYSMALTSDNGLILLGYTSTYTRNKKADLYIVKTDIDGNEQWTNHIGVVCPDLGFDIKEIPEGYIIVGYSWGFRAHKQDVYLIKTNKQGRRIWNRTFFDGDMNNGTSVVPCEDGGYFIAGYTKQNNYAESNLYLIKTNSRGNKVWSKVMDKGVEENATWAAQTQNQNFDIVAVIQNENTNLYETHLITVDKDGNELSDQTLTDNANYINFAALQLIDETYIIAGATDVNPEKTIDVFLLKTKPSF